MSNQNFSAAFPTFPIQNQFGNTIIQFGLNKVEYLTAIIAAQLVSNDKLLPETIAEYSYNIAVAVLEVCEDELKKEIAVNNSDSKTIITDASGK